MRYSSSAQYQIFTLTVSCLLRTSSSLWESRVIKKSLDTDWTELRSICTNGVIITYNRNITFNMANEGNSSLYENVEQWNLSLSNLLVPNDVLLAVYILLGILGNSLVLYIYKARMTETKIANTGYLIPFLAFADLCAATVCGSFGIALNMMQATFYENHICKCWWFFAAFTTLMSWFLLLLIAVQRYIKIVRPGNREMDLRTIRIVLFSLFCLSSIIAGAATTFYGSVPFSSKDKSVTGRRCSKIDDENKVGSIIYGSVLILLSVLIGGSLIGIYSRIGFKIVRKIKRSQTFSNTGTERGENIDAFKDEDRQCSSSDLGSYRVEQNGCPSTISQGRISNELSSKVEKGGDKLNRNHHVKINRKIRHKFTLMFMLITCIFLVCSVPKISIMLVEATNPMFWQGFSDKDRALMLFVYRMYIINNVSNPFVYAFMDSNFRAELKKMCS